MNKQELVDAIASKSGLTKADAKKGLDAFLASVSEEVKKGSKVALVGFGTFFVSERAARKGVNPQTKKTIDTPAKKSVKFKAGSELSGL